MPPQKLFKDRYEEMKKVYTELERLGLGVQFDEIKRFHKVCNDYVRDGAPVSGSINLPFAGRKLVYSFPASAYKECVAYLTSL